MPPRTISSSVCATLFVDPASCSTTAIASAAARVEQRVEERPEDLRRVVPAGDAFFVVRRPAPAADPRCDSSRPSGTYGARFGAAPDRSQVVGDQARRRRSTRCPAASGSNSARSIDVDGLLPVISASAWMFVTSSLIALRFAAIASPARRQVRREQARVLRARRVDDEVGVGDLVASRGFSAERGRGASSARGRSSGPAPSARAPRPRRAADRSGRCRWMRFCAAASTISSSLPSTRPSASIATRNAFVPSVTFSMSPAGSPTSAQ